MAEENQANTAKRGVSLDACLSKLHNPQKDSDYDRCWRVPNLSKIKSMEDIPDIQNVNFWDYYASLKLKYNYAIYLLLAIASPIIYARFRHYQRKIKKKDNS